MNKSELIENIRVELGPDREKRASAEEYVNLILGTIAKALANGEQVSFQGFGKFSITDRPERTGRSPQTGEPCVIPAARSVKFTPSRTLRTFVGQAGQPDKKAGE